jgi:hypothetical protein
LCKFGWSFKLQFQVQPLSSFFQYQIFSRYVFLWVFFFFGFIF